MKAPASSKVRSPPVLAELGFHVLDQEIEVLDVPRNGAGRDLGRFRL